MDAAVIRNLRKKIFTFFGQRVVYHTSFWVVMLILLMILDTSNKSFFFTFSAEFINVLFYAVVVYFNMLYLIPKYLNDKYFLLYCGLLILSVIVVTPIKIFIFFVLFSPFPPIQEQLIADQNWYFASTFLIAGSSTIVKIVSDWIRYQRDRKELQTQTMQSELKFLKSQINPHFLFNTLNSLYALTLKKSEKAPEIVIKLSEMMRYMLYECNEKKVPLQKEVNYIKNYLALEKLRHGSNVDIGFVVKGEVNDQQIAPLMFIPFLENSFKHGLHNAISHGFVNINLNIDNNEVKFHIENSKADSLPLQVHKRSGGIGLVNVKRRLNLLYPGHYDLGINDNPKTYAVNLKIDLD